MANATTTYAQAAYSQANTNAGDITVIQGVDLTQNTNITAANALAQAAYNDSNGASSFANTTFATQIYATAGYNQANTSTTLAQVAYDSGNNTLIYATAGFNEANSATTLAQAAYNDSNGASSFANTTFATSTYATAGYNQANTATTLAQAAYNDSNGASSFANTTFATATYATAAFNKANSVTTTSQAAFDASNGVSSFANTTFATQTYATAGFNKANSATTLAQAAYDSGNTTLTYAQDAFALANTDATNITVIQGVDDTQNTNITNATILAQAAFNASNGSASYANTTFFTKSGGTISGDTTINGNVTVTGTTFYANTVNLRVEDNIITVNSNVTGTPTQNAGLEVNRGTSDNTYMLWNETDKAWEFTNDGTNYDKIAGSSYANAAYALANSTTTYAQAAYAQANTNAGAITVIQGVDLTQNTNITNVTNTATAAFTKANNSVQSISGTSGAIVATASGNTYNINLATTTVTTGTYGGSTNIPVITFDSFGRATSASNVAVSTTINLAGSTGTGSVAGGGTLTVTSSNTQIVSVSALGSTLTVTPTYAPVNTAGSVMSGPLTGVTNLGTTTVTYANGATTSNTFTTASVAQVAVDAFATATYRSAKYQVQMTAGTAYHAIELLLIHDGTTVSLVQYGEVLTGASLGTFDASITGGVLSLLFTATNAVTTVKLICDAINI